jgi:hypothetical protein
MAGSALCPYYYPVADSYRCKLFTSPFLHVWSRTGSFFCCSQCKAVVLYTKTYQEAYRVTAVVFWEMIKKHPVHRTSCLKTQQIWPVIVRCAVQISVGIQTVVGFFILFRPPTTVPRQRLKLGHDPSAHHHLQVITVTQSHSHFLTALFSKETNEQTHNRYSTAHPNKATPVAMYIKAQRLNYTTAERMDTSVPVCRHLVMVVFGVFTCAVCFVPSFGRTFWLQLQADWWMQKVPSRLGIYRGYHAVQNGNGTVMWNTWRHLQTYI